MMEAPCVVCQNLFTFTPTQRQRLYLCSDECTREYKNKQARIARAKPWRREQAKESRRRRLTPEVKARYQEAHEARKQDPEYCEYLREISRRWRRTHKEELKERRAKYDHDYRQKQKQTYQSTPQIRQRAHDRYLKLKEDPVRYAAWREKNAKRHRKPENKILRHMRYLLWCEIRTEKQLEFERERARLYAQQKRMLVTAAAGLLGLSYREIEPGDLTALYHAARHFVGVQDEHRG
jgi:hypothetical protein